MIFLIFGAEAGGSFLALGCATGQWSIQCGSWALPGCCGCPCVSLSVGVVLAAGNHQVADRQHVLTCSCTTVMYLPCWWLSSGWPCLSTANGKRAEQVNCRLQKSFTTA